jgi:hypothetical protein
MEQPPVARRNKRTVGWWECPVIVLIAVSALPAYAALSALPAYAALCMTIIAWAVLKFHPTALQGMNAGAKLQAWADLARFFAMATAPIGLVICVVVSFASFRSRAARLGWLIMVGGFLGWCVAGLLIGRP